MNHYLWIWILLFLAAIGLFNVLADILRISMKLFAFVLRMVRTVVEDRPIRHFKCWLICNHRGIDFHNFKLVFNYDYKAINNYLKTNRRR